MSRTAIAIVACLASLSVASVASAQAMHGPQEPVIITSGRAAVKRAPDRAWLTVSTEVRDARAADARRKSADIMTAVENALKGTGLPGDAIRTTGFSLTPEVTYTGGVGQVRGYVVHHQIEVRVDDLDKLSQVIDAANAPKSAGLSIVGPRFDLKHREAAEQDVLRLAVEHALMRAQAIATGARRSLGAIQRIDDTRVMTDIPTPRPMAATRTAAAVETPITPGVIEIVAEVTVAIGIR